MFATATRMLKKSVGQGTAFVFDIDGVLLRGHKAIPQAKAALELLNSHRVPWILLTNGGGQSERERVAKLSNMLDVSVSESQLVQAHTPFRSLAEKYHRVLVTGGEGDKCRKVGEEIYGFKDVVIPADIVKADPSVWPFHRFTSEELNQIARTRNFYAPESGEAKIDAVLVFNDPRDMGTDIQIVMDLLLSQHGYIGTRRDLHTFHSNADLSVPSVPIYFCCNDLLWANNYRLPRFGQGQFRIIIERLYEEMTKGAKLQSTIIGKPYKFTYSYAEQALMDWRSKRFGISEPLQRVFMVGDNPASDILGANNYGWHSILVRTGVFRDEDLPEIVSKPKTIVDNVKDAVEFGITYGL